MEEGSFWEMLRIVKFNCKRILARRLGDPDPFCTYRLDVSTWLLVLVRSLSVIPHPPLFDFYNGPGVPERERIGG